MWFTLTNPGRLYYTSSSCPQFFFSLIQPGGGDVELDSECDSSPTYTKSEFPILVISLFYNMQKSEALVILCLYEDEPTNLYFLTQRTAAVLFSWQSRCQRSLWSECVWMCVYSLLSTHRCSLLPFTVFQVYVQNVLCMCACQQL